MDGTIERSCKLCDYKAKLTYQFTSNISSMLVWDNFHKAGIVQLELQVADHVAQKHSTKPTDLSDNNFSDV